MAKIIKLTEGDLSRIVKRVIREEESDKEEKIEMAKEALSDILNSNELNFLKQKIEDEGKEEFKHEVVAAVKDVKSNEDGELSEEEMDSMSEDEYKLRSIIHKIMEKATVLSGIGIVPAAMFAGAPTAVGLGIASLLGVIFKDAAFWKRGGHHYDEQERSKRESMKESYKKRQYRRRY